MKSRETEIACLNKWNTRNTCINCRKRNWKLFALCSIGFMRNIQREMARLWTEYTARTSAAQEVAQAEAAGVQKRVALLERENSKSQSFLAPIRRLPTELLAAIFVIAITCHGQKPFDMIRVCQTWRATISGMARIWSHLTLRPSTAQEYVDFAVERTKQVSLEVLIDSNKTSHSSHGYVGEGKQYIGIALALKTMPRWKAVNVVSFPDEADFIRVAEEAESVMDFVRPLEKLKVFKLLVFARQVRNLASSSTPSQNRPPKSLHTSKSRARISYGSFPRLAFVPSSVASVTSRST